MSAVLENTVLDSYRDAYIHACGERDDAILQIEVLKSQLAAEREISRKWKSLNAHSADIRDHAIRECMTDGVVVDPIYCSGLGGTDFIPTELRLDSRHVMELMCLSYEIREKAEQA